jgi:hypothetical protein
MACPSEEIRATSMPTAQLPHIVQGLAGVPKTFIEQSPQDIILIDVLVAGPSKLGHKLGRFQKTIFCHTQLCDCRGGRIASRCQAGYMIAILSRAAKKILGSHGYEVFETAMTAHIQVATGEHTTS